MPCPVGEHRNPTRSAGVSHLEDRARRRHPDTGREVLYLGRRGNAYIPELSETDGEALLNELWSYTVPADNTWHHEWRVGDVLLWDNRCTMHRRDDFDPATRRIMHRSQIRGTRMNAAA